MHSNIDLILTLTAALTAAVAFGLITHRFRLSPIVGYLLAGIVLGPFTPGFVARHDIAEQFAELGVVLLMFGVGLHFHVKDLWSVRRVALPGAVVQIAVATGLGLLVARAAGWSFAAGIVYGLAISVASTVVLIRVLSDNDALHGMIGRVAVGWLIVEDLFTVVVLVLLPVIAKGGSSGFATLGVALAKVVALFLLVLVVGSRIIPRLLARVARARSRELFTLTVLVVVLGVAVVSTKLFGVSMALGAFLAGMVVGQSDFSARAAADALPMRDAFAVLFFVSMGMLFDPSAAVAHLGTTAATLVVVLLGKPLAAFLLVLGLRQGGKLAIAVAVALAQIGEFSFLLAALAVQLKILPPEAAQPLVVASIVSITLNPFIYRLVDPVGRALEVRLGTKPPVVGPDAPRPGMSVVVVGYGPIGRTLTRLLLDLGLSPTVIELNYHSIATIRADGARAVHGDALHSHVLEAAGIHDAIALVFAASGSPAAETVRIARELNPDIHVIARTEYIRDVEEVRSAGATVVVASETEVALAMAEHLLRELGSTPEQMDRERERVRAAITQ